MEYPSFLTLKFDQLVSITSLSSKSLIESQTGENGILIDAYSMGIRLDEEIIDNFLKTCFDLEIPVNIRIHFSCLSSSALLLTGWSSKGWINEIILVSPAEMIVDRNMRPFINAEEIYPRLRSEIDIDEVEPSQLERASFFLRLLLKSSESYDPFSAESIRRSRIWQSMLLWASSERGIAFDPAAFTRLFPDRMSRLLMPVQGRPRTFFVFDCQNWQERS